MRSKLDDRLNGQLHAMVDDVDVERRNQSAVGPMQAVSPTTGYLSQSYGSTSVG